MTDIDFYIVVWLLAIPFWIGVLKNFRSPALEIDTFDYVCCILWPLSVAVLLFILACWLAWRMLGWLPMKLGEKIGAVVARLLL